MFLENSQNPAVNCTILIFHTLLSPILAAHLPRTIMVRKNFKRFSRISRYVIYKETLIDFNENLLSFIGSMIGIGVIAYMQSQHLLESDNIMLIGSFGATSVLIFGIIQSPLAQPRNLVGGHFLSAIVGVTVCKVFPDILWISAPLSVSLAIVVMQITKTLHPPGGATALIAVIGSDSIKSLGYTYVLSPVMSGVLIMLIVALIFNNLSPKRSYPASSNFTKRLNRLSSYRSLRKLKRNRNHSELV